MPSPAPAQKTDDRVGSLFLFTGVLNTFLAPADRGRPIHHRFRGTPSVKDRIETLGVPHTEVGFILVDHASADHRRLLKGGETVLVLPQLAAHWREQPALNALDTLPPAFVADVNLGRLARLLRLLGFDTLYRNDYDDAAVAAAATNGRVILTRDRRLLMRRQIDFGCFVHADRPRLQAREVLNRFKLHALVQPFSRCSHCNGQVRRADKQAVLDQLQPKTRRYYQRFWQCTRCGQVYWEGSHLQGLRDLLSELKAA